ncbi:MAG: mycothiol synthase [Acidimicrobiales bacterium]|nr:mycothiol synthase [Acidimicrobiales bacterium]
MGDEGVQEPAIRISQDREGDIVEVDASRWSADALSMALRDVLTRIAESASLWLDNPAEDTDEILARLGLEPQRDLFRMERSIPLEQRTEIATRPFEVGQDENEWCEVNNRAFSWHREQSGWTPALLREHQEEPWFDAEGFLIHERDERIAAFCWTKVHATEAPPVGEVFVIAVDPDFHGLGLGRALTLAGYQHLENSGITRAMLYVDADNTPAVNLYRDIGLEVETVRRLYQRQTQAS